MCSHIHVFIYRMHMFAFPGMYFSVKGYWALLSVIPQDYMLPGFEPS